MKVKILFIFLIAILLCPKIPAQQCTIYNNHPHETNLDIIYTGTDIKTALDSIVNIGFYTLKIDSSFFSPCTAYVTKGAQYRRIYIESNDSIILKNISYDQLVKKFYTNNLDSFLLNYKKILKRRGQIFDEISVKPKGYFNEHALVYIQNNHANKRWIDDIKFLGYAKIPRYIKKGILKDSLLYNTENTTKITKKLEELSFLTLTDSPKVSFTKDSTVLYVYTKKIKQSFFNGILGFETDDNNLNLQGNLQLRLMNTFNGNEKIHMDWKSGLNKSQFLNIEFFLPSLMNNKFALESNLNLTKQDSTYFKMEWRNSVLYKLNTNHYIGVNFNLTNSNHILQSTSDYNKKGFGVKYLYEDFNLQKLQENKTHVKLSSTIWQRKLNNTDLGNLKQTEINYLIERQQKVYKNHYIQLKLYGGNLIYDGLKLENDIYQIGGFQTLRGFNQNSIITPSFNTISISYRYIPSNSIYLETFTDLAFVDNLESTKHNFLNSYGIGSSFSTNIGWFQIYYAVGSGSTNSFNLSEGKIHFGLKSYF